MQWMCVGSVCKVLVGWSTDWLTSCVCFILFFHFFCFYLRLEGLLGLFENVRERERFSSLRLLRLFSLFYICWCTAATIIYSFQFIIHLFLALFLSLCVSLVFAYGLLCFTSDVAAAAAVGHYPLLDWISLFIFILFHCLRSIFHSLFLSRPMTVS